MFRSFRTQLTLLFGTLALALAGVLSYEFGNRLTHQATNERGDALRHLADATAALMAEGLHERMREVDLLARSNEIARIGLDPQAWRTEINRLRSGRPHYAWIGVTDADGTVVAASDGLLVGADVSKRPWFVGATKGAYVGDVHTAKLLAKLLPASDDGGPLRFIDFAAPLRDAEGRLIGTLGVHADWRWARDVIALLHSDDSRDAGVEVLIVDRAGKVIHDPQGSAAASGTARTAPALGIQPQMHAWSDGSHLTAATLLPARSEHTDMGWLIVARQPAAAGLAAARAAQRAAWAVGCLVACAAMVIVWIVAGRFSRPLERIAIVADHILDGDRQVAIPVSRGTSELERLSSSLALMTHHLVEHGEALQDANRELERRVGERTAELARANEELGRANADLDHLAHRDALTGLANRRAADHALAHMLRQHRRYGRSLGVLLIDIDHFKRVNDSHGHAVGDRVLQALANCLRETLRDSDLPARFGGEEFLVVLPETDAEGVAHVAEKLRAAIEALALPSVGGITASFGAALAEQGRESAVSLLQRADVALYAAKGAGRNRVHSAEAPTTAFLDSAMLESV
ncbi:MAG TPA: diguanylate cyclase [Methylibium sp.]|uniref:diguanylate cyclase n=1 Tax=Methylibium sp. TaxID=2067992 RepID=UPI002DB99D58|nr:diguanylate cyclase [Methylibium sp.]HEU4458319.1 diguanylate cyclase [Methylibium sp.]